MFPSLGRQSGKEKKLEVEEEDVGEVNCRKLRGLDRGPVPVIPRGRNLGSVCVQKEKEKSMQ